MRLFVAVNLPDLIRTGIDQALQPLRQSVDSLGARIKWTAPEQYHMTMKFLGDCSDEQVPKIKETLQQASASSHPFAVTLAELGCFPARGKPTILWLAVKEGAETITRLAGDLDRTLEPLGFVKDPRPFSAHVTVGRVQWVSNGVKLRQALEATATLTLGPFNAESLELMQSVLSQAGPRYTLLKASSFPAVTGGESMDPRQRHSGMTT